MKCRSDDAAKRFTCCHVLFKFQTMGKKHLATVKIYLLMYFYMDLTGLLPCWPLCNIMLQEMKSN